MRREAAARAALRPDRLSAHQRTKPQRPKSAANVRDFQRRRRQRAKTNTETDATTATVASPRLYGNENSHTHRRIIELSVGIEQLLHMSEGQEEERVVATLSASLAALSTNLILKKQSDVLSHGAAAEVARLLVRVRTMYDAEYLKQRNRVKALEHEVQQLTSHLTACPSPEKEDMPVHVGVVDHVALLRYDYEKKRLKNAREGITNVAEVGKRQETKDTKAREALEISGSSRFLLEDSVSEFNANSVSPPTIEEGSNGIFRNTSTKLVYTDPWFSAEQNKPVVSLGTQTEVAPCPIPKTLRLPKHPPTSRKKVNTMKETQSSSVLRQAPVVKVNVLEKGTQVTVQATSRSTQSVMRLTRGRACQTDKVHRVELSDSSSKAPSENPPPTNKKPDATQASKTHGKANTNTFKKARKSKANKRKARSELVKPLYDPSVATRSLLALAEKNDAEDRHGTRPWTPAETTPNMNSSQVWDSADSKPQSGGISADLNTTERQGMFSSGTRFITNAQQGSHASRRNLVSTPRADPSVLFGKELSLTGAPVQTRLFMMIQSSDIREKEKRKVRAQDVEKLVSYIRDLLDATVDNSALTMQSLAKFGLPEIVEADFVRRFGIRRIVDQKLFELLVNVAKHRDSSQEVRYFAELLEERLRPRSEFCFMLEVRRAAKRSQVGRLLSPSYGQGAEVLDFERALDVSLRVLRRLPHMNHVSERAVVSQLHALEGSHSLVEGLQKQADGQRGRANKLISLVDVLDTLATCLRNIQTRKAVADWSAVAFESADDDGDGFLSFSQFQQFFERLSPPPSRRVIEIAFQSGVRKSFSNRISLDQFIGAATCILRSMPTLQSSSSTQSLTGITMAFTAQDLPDLSQAVPIWRVEDEKLERHHLRNRWARRLTVAEKRFRATQMGVAQNVLATVTEQWARLAPKVDVYHQMLYHAEDKYSVEIAKALSRARTEMEAAQSHQGVNRADMELDGTSRSAGDTNTISSAKQLDRHVSPGMVHSAHSALYWFRKILALVSDHQICLRYRLGMSGCAVSGLKKELCAFANIIEQRWSRPGWLAGSAENTQHALLGPWTDNRRKELLSRLGSREHDWLCSPVEVNGDILLEGLENTTRVGEETIASMHVYEAASRHDLRLLFLDV